MSEADINSLRLSRASPEYTVNALRSELAAVRQRLATAEIPPPAPPE